MVLKTDHITYTEAYDVEQPVITDAAVYEPGNDGMDAVWNLVLKLWWSTTMRAIEP